MGQRPNSQAQKDHDAARRLDDRWRARSLIAWFEHAQRDLPWRRERHGYAALVSEAMLQQTQVDRVVRIFEAFMARFPCVDALVAADEQDVLAMWQGLGYYRRARHLHAAALAIVERHGGKVPLDAATLAKLPGVGRYTAGAIASIVGGSPEPIVDGNVRRVIARWDALPAEQCDGADDRVIWERAGQLVAVASSPGAFNEAIMELGALVCTPSAPDCANCPVAKRCQAQLGGVTSEIPPPRRRVERVVVHHHSVVMMRGDSVLLEQRDRSGMWAGMWQPPAVESERPLTDPRIIEALRVKTMRVTPIGRFVHQTTHRSVTFVVYRGVTRQRSGRWQPVADLNDAPMSNAHKRVVRMAMNSS